MKPERRHPNPAAPLAAAVLLALTTALTPTTRAAPIQPALRAADIALEAAAKTSGRTLPVAGRTAFREALEAAVTRHGDDVLNAVRRGGIELLEAAGRLGDDVFRFAAAHPQGARQLALRADEVLPLARRIGPAALEIEARVPGAASPLLRHFGPDGARRLAGTAPGEMRQLIGLAARADGPATRTALLEAFERRGPRFLQALDARRILAVGLTTAMITAAYQVSDGVQDGLLTVARDHPATFADTVVRSAHAITWPLMIGGTVAGLVLIGRLVPRRRGARRTAPPEPETASAEA